MHWLRHHPHLQHYFASHPRSKTMFLSVCDHYPRLMHHNLASHHYCHWLLNFMQSHHHLPGIDLLLGA
jgi:hypothetical protein